MIHRENDDIEIGHPFHLYGVNIKFFVLICTSDVIYNQTTSIDIYYIMLSINSI